MIVGVLNRCTPSASPIGTAIVTIFGSNIGSGSDIYNVTFGGIAASQIISQNSSVVVVSVTSLTAVANANIAVYSVSYGTSSLSSAFSFLVGMRYLQATHHCIR